ncbi:hypothetical protein [Streptomyces sp. H34-S4]|uniref:hypothetical protein n=1 Tax=Streptomyces sp. H34-S4 TaxID=2996463 RepID=UPI002270F7F0|nr:hypothetical protein [Streptomyces sp. H34-S4]MCY0939392.1 hypothetical protein [Streptomyces sp. H34-S4]
MADTVAAGKGAAGDGIRTRRARAAHPWQRRIALAALLLPVAPVVVMMLVEGLPAARTSVPVLLLAAPTVLRADRARFTASCVTLAALLLPWSVSGLSDGAWIFLPSALMLLCATFADPRAHGAPAALAAALAGLVAVVPGLVSWSAVMTLSPF